MKKYLVCGLCLFVLAIGLASPMPLRALTVKSADIAPADGTSGQVLTTGNGVKTGHIQNLAVTGAKIAAGTITTGNIGNSQITNAILAPNAITTDKIQDGAVGTADLADGAVNDAKITGVISAAKLPVGTAAGTVAAGDHSHDGLYLKKYGKVAIVAQSGGDYTSPVDAMSDIGVWCGTPSSTNPCLVKIMPGVYDIGSQTVQMQEYVDIEGSGENTTVIQSSTSALFDGTVNGASYAEIRFLTVKNTSTVGNAVAFVNDGVSTKLTFVTLTASGGAVNTFGILNENSSSTMTNVTVVVSGGSYVCFAVYNDYSTVTLTNVTATASNSGGNNYGIFNYASSPILINVIANGTGAGESVGVYLTAGSSVVADRCSFQGSQYSISNISSGTAKIGASKLVGGVNGATTCAVSYDGDYAALGADCR